MRSPITLSRMKSRVESSIEMLMKKIMEKEEAYAFSWIAWNSSKKREKKEVLVNLGKKSLLIVFCLLLFILFFILTMYFKMHIRLLLSCHIPWEIRRSRDKTLGKSQEASNDRLAHLHASFDMISGGRSVNNSSVLRETDFEDTIGGKNRSFSRRCHESLLKWLSPLASGLCFGR